MDVEKLEELRKKVLYYNHKKNINNLIGIILAIPFYLTISFIPLLESIILLLLSILTIEIIIYFIILQNIAKYKKEINKYTNLYKKEIVVSEFKQYFSNIEFDPEKGISKKTIKETNLIAPKTNYNYNSNDYIKAKYKNTDFKMADINIRKINKHRKYTIFKGQWFIFNLNKKINCNLELYSKNLGNSIYTVKTTKVLPNAHKVKTENIEFNNKFDIFAENEHDAFYILTPPMMEKILWIEKQYNCPIIFAIINNELHLALYTNSDLLEPNIKKNNLSNRNIEKIKTETFLIKNLIDILNEDLFKG